MAAQAEKAMMLTYTIRIFKTFQSQSAAPKVRSAITGFTLVELLIVTLILATLAALLGVNLTGRSDTERLAFEANRLAALVNLARTQAVAKRQSWGLVSQEDGYYFVLYGDSLTEVDRVQTAPFIGRRLDGLTLSVANTDRRDIQLVKLKNQKLPDVFILASGECTPFKIDLRNKFGQTFRVQSDGFSQAKAQLLDPLS